MKTFTKLVLAFIAFIITSNICFAQLKVRTNGTVKIGAGSPYPDAGSLQVVESNKTTEARIFATTPNISRLWTVNSVYGFGFGIDASGMGQIVGNLNTPTNLISFNSSACMGINYSPGTTYKLYVGGSAYCTGVWQPSDRNLKRDILPIEGAMEKLLKIKGKTYFYQNNENNSKKSDSTFRLHYGFIAQDVQEVLPDLVQEVGDSCNTLAINYDGFIPLLVEALKKQQQTLQLLENEVQLLKLNKTVNLQSDGKSANKLFQNTPNPFSRNTDIEYEIESNAFEALINIYDMQGTQIKSYKLTDKGKSKITISASELNPGIYFYSLLVDGKIIDSKQMVLTN